MEDVSNIKQETDDGYGFEKHYPDLPEYVDIKHGVVSEKPDISLKQEVQKNILVKSELCNEDITPLLTPKVENYCETEEFTQPDLIVAEDLNNILGENSTMQVKSEVGGNETCNSSNKNCSKDDLGVAIEPRFPTRVKVYECEICGEGFNEKISKNLHMTSHFDKGSIPCTECGKPFDEQVFYLEHYNAHFQFSCPNCDKRFVTESCLEIHQKSHINEVNTSSQETIPDATSVASQKRFKCRYCPEDFSSRSEMFGHESSHGRPLLRCDICQRNFAKPSEMKSHQRIHTGSKPFSCSLCAKTFAQRAAMTVHQNTAHSEGKKFQCELCQQRFSYKSSLKRHMRLHRGEKPYKCDQCDKSFQSRHALETHLNIHDGKLPFACSECPRSFRLSYALKRHYRNHSSGHQEALPFQCDGCWKSFAREETLQQHQTRHETIKCDTCDKQFAKKSDLLSHRLVHVEETFTCELCDKRFRWARSLKRHMIRHEEKVKVEVA